MSENRIIFEVIQVLLPPGAVISGHAEGDPSIPKSEGSITFAQGLDPVMRIHAGENNGLVLQSESGIGFEADGNVRFNVLGFAIDLAAVPVHANNAAAVAAGLFSGALYRTGGDPDQLCIVH